MPPLVRLTALLIAAGCMLAADPPGNEVHPIHLGPNDYGWEEVVVQKTPYEVDYSYRVLDGDRNVRVELLSKSQFDSFKRGKDHDSLAATPAGAAGEFRRIIDQRGRYEIVLENAGRGPAAISGDLRLNANPGAGVAKVLPPRRRLTVILISFAFFFVTVAWSGRKLLRAVRL